jgi:hypothetical protein
MSVAGSDRAKIHVAGDRLSMADLAATAAGFAQAAHPGSESWCQGKWDLSIEIKGVQASITLLNNTEERKRLLNFPKAY